MRPVIDTDKCSGHGRCYATAPDVFDCDDEGFSVLLSQDVTEPAAVAQLWEAIANCPERAISVRDGS